jgi:DNA/RNA-binding domain of Phe-tRNA-synthetase-like protein
VSALKVTIDETVFNEVPELKIGINYYTKITVSESPQMLKGRLHLFQEHLFFELENKKVQEFPGIAEWRSIWKAFGADPNRYRHSTEALLRRIAKQNYLKPFHSAVDLNNFFSLQHELPIGIYDVDKLQGDLTISVGTEEVGYEGLNGRFNSLHKILYAQDESGPFGSPFVDSIRTAVTNETTDAIQLFFIGSNINLENATELTEACGKMFTQISGGDVTTQIIHRN